MATWGHILELWLKIEQTELGLYKEYYNIHGPLFSDGTQQSCVKHAFKNTPQTKI